MDPTIVYLKDYQEYLTVVSQWSFDAWSKYNPQATRKAYIKKYKQHCQKDALPLTLLALNNNKLMGMCSLRKTEGIQSEVTPWLGSLYVAQAYRKQKVAEKLIDAVKEVAAEMNFDKLYLFTFEKNLIAYYSKLGWSHVREDELNGYPIWIMSTTTK